MLLISRPLPYSCLSFAPLTVLLLALRILAYRSVRSVPHRSRALSLTQNPAQAKMRGKAEAQSIYPNAYLKLPKKNYEIHKVSRNFLWRRHPDLNWGIKVLQTSALPLGYVAELARVAGFEPANDGIRIRCLTAWRYPKI